MDANSVDFDRMTVLSHWDVAAGQRWQHALPAFLFAGSQERKMMETAEGAEAEKGRRGKRGVPPSGQ